MSSKSQLTISNSQPFVQADDLQIIISKGGVQKQVPVFTRKGIAYAKVLGGFVGLYVDRATSVPSIKWKDFVYAGESMPKMGKGKMNLLSITPNE